MTVAHREAEPFAGCLSQSWSIVARLEEVTLPGTGEPRWVGEERQGVGSPLPGRVTLRLVFVGLMCRAPENNPPGSRQARTGGQVHREVREPTGEAGVPASGRPQ